MQTCSRDYSQLVGDRMLMYKTFYLVSLVLFHWNCQYSNGAVRHIKRDRNDKRDRN